MNKFLLSITFCFSLSIAFSQGEADWWYFGANAGLHFNPNPTPVTGGQLNTIEGVASISDAAGNLLFYTDGTTVYTKTHTVMANGTGLMGDPSSTQSAIIVQMPGNNKLYYIFTAALATSTNGFRYSVVDITLNAGLGGVTAQKNVAVYQPTTERICAVRHCNNTDIWIVSHFWGTNEFRAHLLTAAGLNMTAVSSNVGTVNISNSGMSIGYLKASPAGNKLSMVMRYTAGGSNASIVELYDFDNTSGAVSNAVNLGGGYSYGCGVEFSSDGALLYTNTTNPSKIYQYNLCAGSSAQITASQLQVGTSTSAWMGAMQLGPDKKIYVARYQSNFLGVINSSTTLGAGCNYVDNGLSLGSMQSNFGLPNFFPTYISYYHPVLSSTINCLNGNFSYAIPPPSCIGAGIVQSFQWNFGDAASGANNISTTASPAHVFSSAGTYTVKLALNFNCYSDTGTLIVNVNSCGVTVTGTGDTICAGDCGNVSALASGGATPYTYIWTPNIGSGAGPFSVCPATTTSYKVVATDLNGLSDSTIVQVVVNNVPVVNPTSTNVTCFSNNDGTAATNATGNSPFTYSWNSSPIQTTDTASNLSQGNYSVTTTDVNGCSASGSVIISEPNLLTATINSFTDVNCNGGNDGSATVLATGGTVAYNYLWNDGQTTATATNLIAGNYAVTVTDANNCTASASVIISEPSLLTASISSFTNVSCGGGNNGSANVLATGGTVAYNYLWSDGQTAATPTNLVAGNYVVTVTDANTCSTSASVTISEPTPLTISITSFTDVSCNAGNNGSAAALANGGAVGYNYLWSSGQTSSSITNLISGNYIITVTDANACSASASVAISEPALLAVSINFFTNVSCNGAYDGTADALATGGTTAYNYLWSSGQTSSSITNLSAGNYVITVTDANACSASASVIVSEPSALLVTMNTPVNVNCNAGNTGSTSVNVSGGTPVYVYNWSDGQTTASAINLVATNYSVTVTDANTCSASTSVTITEPSALSITMNAPVNVNCNGDNSGSATVNTSGGTPVYTYAWSNAQTTFTAINLTAGAFSVTVTDANSCSISASVTVTEPPLLTVVAGTLTPPNCFGSSDGVVSIIASGGTPAYQYLWNTIPSQNTSTITGLSGGNYSVTVSDANNCTATENMNITEPSLLTVSIDPTPFVEIFSGGSTTLVATASSVVTNYQWSPSIGLNCSTCASTLASPATTTNYTVVVTNANNCTANATVQVIVTNPHVVFVPNVFSPNNDGSNDFFQIFGTLDQIAFMEIQIFNRWGEKVFESSDHHFGWDGTYKGENAPQGIYTYQLKLTYMNGERDELRKGSLTLLR